MKLYTYLPEENTALSEGLLSTALTDKGFEKYRGRTGKYTKEDVLKVLDSWEPEWTRSKAISALTEPIPEDAAEDFLEFARNRRLYSFDTKDLIKAKILAHIRRARKGGGTDPVDEAKKEHPNWHRKKKHLLFQGVPHYFVETTGGRIPPEFVTEEKKSEEGDDKSLAKARAFVAAVKKMALKRKLNMFLVTDGASGILNNGNPAVRNARDAQIKWELEHGADPYEDWEHSEKKAADADIEAKARTHYPSEGSHGWNHIQDVLANARRMRRRELLRKELAAIMYHDSSLMTGGRDTHAEDSAEIARKELAGLFKKEQLADIVNAIAHHRASYEGARSSKLEDLVAAADRPVPDLDKQVARSWKYHEELGEPEDLRARNVASHLKEKYGHGGYAYGNAPKLYLKTYGKELRDIMSKFDGLTPESVAAIMSGAEKKAEMSRDRIQAQYARHPQSSLDILAARLAKRKWGPKDVVREYDAHSREYDETKEDKEFLDRYIIARIGEKYDRKAKIKQALMRRLWEKEHNGESFDAALPYRMARFRQYEDIPFPTEKKAADRNFLSVFRDLANMPQTASNPTDDDIRAAFKVDPAKVRGHDTVPHFMASVENVNPQMGRKLWGLAKGRVLPRVSVFSGSTPRDLRSTADAMVEARQSWPNGVNTTYAALTNMYDRVVRKTGKPVWDVANARPTEYGKMGNGFSLNIK